MRRRGECSRDVARPEPGAFERRGRWPNGQVLARAAVLSRAPVRGPAALDRNALGEIIEQRLAPVLGGTLARGAVRAQLARLGIEGDTLDSTQIDRVLTALEKGLRVFVGSAKAAALIAEVRGALPQEAR